MANHVKIRNHEGAIHFSLIRFSARDNDVELRITYKDSVNFTSPHYALGAVMGKIVQCCAVQCSAVQCSAAQRSAVQCSAVLCSAMW
jgi:hypothetical protein